MKSKCKCGDVFGFKVHEVLLFAGLPEREQALRRFVTVTSKGCIGRLTFPGSGQIVQAASTYQGYSYQKRC